MEDRQLDLIIEKDQQRGPCESICALHAGRRDYSIRSADYTAGERLGYRYAWYFMILRIEPIVSRGARLLGFDLTKDGAIEIARAGAARHASLVGFWRVRDLRCRGSGLWMPQRRTDVEPSGCRPSVCHGSALSHVYCGNYGGPVGGNACSVPFEQRDTIEEVIEPYLPQGILCARRVPALAAEGYRHLGLQAPMNIISWI